MGYRRSVLAAPPLFTFHSPSTVHVPVALPPVHGPVELYVSVIYMPGTWKSSYLLNLVLVAKANGDVKPIEVLYLSRCRTKIDGNHHTLADSIMRSYWESVTETGSMISDEATLKDMLIMAMADGDTSSEEQELVCRFIDIAKISQQRVEAIMREAMNRYNDEMRGVNDDNEIRMGKYGCGLSR